MARRASHPAPPWSAPRARILAQWHREEFAEFPELAAFYRAEVIDRATMEVERIAGRGAGRAIVESILGLGAAPA